ncbi:MAG: hypothetical protein WDA27_03190 [Actinomycetota bacterium]
MFNSSRPRALARHAPAVIVTALMAILPAQAGLLAVRARAVAPPHTTAAAPAPSVEKPASVQTSAEPRPVPTRVVQAPRRAAARAPSDRLSVFGGLGAWVDLYDYGALDPARAVAMLRSHGVRTLYMQTARYNSGSGITPVAGRWLVAAHRAGIKVVGWYLPDYADMSRDVARTVAVARARISGHRFDAVGIDIEEKANVKGRDDWNRRVARHASLVRAELGRSYPLTAITPTPLGMAVAPARWAGFPWRSLAASTDVMMLMNYWSYRTDCPTNADHCAYGYTRGNVDRVRALVGKSVPIHVIGGVADVIDAAEVADFAHAALDSRVFGASLYDLRTTADAFWGLLERLA